MWHYAATSERGKWWGNTQILCPIFMKWWQSHLCWMDQNRNPPYKGDFTLRNEVSQRLNKTLQSEKTKTRMLSIHPITAFTTKRKMKETCFVYILRWNTRAGYGEYAIGKVNWGETKDKAVKSEQIEYPDSG